LVKSAGICFSRRRCWGCCWGWAFERCAAAGCAVIPAGPGNTEQQLDIIGHLRPSAYVGTPDFLKILLDAADKAGRDITCIKRAVVSGAAFPPSLQAEIKARGIDAFQMYATADLGLVAYETAARQGMVLAEDVLLEIVRPGTGEPVAEGEVGEVVVTSFDHHHPWIRLALGDLSPAQATDESALLRDFDCGSGRASISSGVEVDCNEVIVLGNSRRWSGPLRIAQMSGQVAQTSFVSLVWFIAAMARTPWRMVAVFSASRPIRKPGQSMR
jgi:phenylacetate-coenzyme A ligase PaaK-like adenylate-forming protein